MNYFIRVLFVWMAMGTFLVPHQLYGSDSDPILKELQERYRWGYMFLTFSSISDLTQLLKSDNSYREIIAAIGDAGPNALKKLLSDYQVSTNAGISFISIDLNNGKAGFKLADDGGGVINELAWSKEQTVQVAKLCDRYLTRSHWLSTNLTSDDSLTARWEILKQAKSDPFVSPVILATFEGRFKQQMEHSDEMTRLAISNHDLAKEIEGFATAYKTNTKVGKAVVAQFGEERVFITLEDKPTIVKINPWVTTVDKSGSVFNAVDVGVGSPVTIRFTDHIGGATATATKVVVDPEAVQSNFRN